VYLSRFGRPDAGGCSSIASISTDFSSRGNSRDDDHRPPWRAQPAWPAPARRRPKGHVHANLPSPCLPSSTIPRGVCRRLAAAVTSDGCSESAPSSMAWLRILYDGRDHRWLLFAPKSFKPGLPLILRKRVVAFPRSRERS
jgi:hypothetical protein